MNYDNFLLVYYSLLLAFIVSLVIALLVVRSALRSRRAGRGGPRSPGEAVSHAGAPRGEDS